MNNLIHLCPWCCKKKNLIKNLKYLSFIKFSGLLKICLILLNIFVKLYGFFTNYFTLYTIIVIWNYAYHDLHCNHFSCPPCARVFAVWLWYDPETNSPPEFSATLSALLLLSCFFSLILANIFLNIATPSFPLSPSLYLSFFLPLAFFLWMPSPSSLQTIDPLLSFLAPSLPPHFCPSPQQLHRLRSWSESCPEGKQMFCLCCVSAVFRVAKLI